MADKKPRNDTEGTFARLYDVQEEMSRRQSKPLGRPPKKVARKPTTVHLTPEEKRKLAEIKLAVDDHFSVNQSELIGVAVQLLSVVMQYGGQQAVSEGRITDMETFRRVVCDIVKL